MSIETVGHLLRLLRQHQLLGPDQLEQLEREEAAHAAADLARELVRRGWLTTFQVNRLFQGKAQEIVLGGYVLLERLGAGGMGEVFKARHRNLGRIDALKVVRKERLASDDRVRRFYREIQAAAQLDSLHVVHAYDAVGSPGTELEFAL